jgi:hypothetical protein
MYPPKKYTKTPNLHTCAVVFMYILQKPPTIFGPAHTAGFLLSSLASRLSLFLVGSFFPLLLTKRTVVEGELGVRRNVLGGDESEVRYIVL